MNEIVQKSTSIFKFNLCRLYIRMAFDLFLLFRKKFSTSNPWWNWTLYFILKRRVSYRFCYVLHVFPVLRLNTFIGVTLFQYMNSLFFNVLVPWNFIKLVLYIWIFNFDWYWIVWDAFMANEIDMSLGLGKFDTAVLALYQFSLYGDW